MGGNYRQTKNLYCIILDDKRRFYKPPESEKSSINVMDFNELNKLEDEGTNIR